MFCALLGHDHLPIGTNAYAWRRTLETIWHALVARLCAAADKPLRLVLLGNRCDWITSPAALFNLMRSAAANATPESRPLVMAAGSIIRTVGLSTPAAASSRHLLEDARICAGPRPPFACGARLDVDWQMVSSAGEVRLQGTATAFYVRWTCVSAMELVELLPHLPDVARVSAIEFLARELENPWIRRRRRRSVRNRNWSPTAT